jgi:D-galactarolactone cycloisomerase
MKIVSISTFILRVPLGKERFLSSQCAFPERNSLLVRLETDDGLVGWGEGGQYGPPEPVAACIKYVLGPMIQGRELSHPAKVWEELYASTRDFGQKGSYIEAISAIDIALWDIFGKSLNLPVHALIGGAFRDRIQAYATGCYYRGEDYLDISKSLPLVTEEAASYVKSGFKIIKIKIGLLNFTDEIARVEAIRSAIGPDTALLVDCNHAYNAHQAITIGKHLERLDVRWMEEPVTPEDREGYRRVRDALRIPIAGGECEFTRFGFRDLFAGGCVDIAQPDICGSGGFSEWMKIQTLASCYGVSVVPHVWGSGVALAAGLHVSACIPPTPHTVNPVPLQNEPVIEYDRNPNPLRDELLMTSVSLEDGYLRVPQGPGLGIEINMDAVNKYGQAF